MKPYGKTRADLFVCAYGCCGGKLHRYSSGFDLFTNRRFKKAVRDHLRGKARALNKRIVVDALDED